MKGQEIPAKRMVLGVPVTCFRSYEHAVEYITQRIKEKKKTFCIAINPEKVCFAHADGAFHEIVRDAEIQICDGTGTALATWLLWGMRIPRITGVSLFFEMMAAAETRGLKVFLLGAKPQTNARAAEKLLEKYPRLRIAGQHDGYFKDDDALVEEINASGADLLFVALGSPRQERWITQHRGELNAPFCMGIGGTLDVLTGHVKWAPAFFRKTGTEWLYRLIKEPWRWKRQLVLPGFALDVMRQRIRPKEWVSAVREGDIDVANKR